jgi:hypothetical protein
MSHESSRFDVNDVLDCMRTDVPAGSADAKRRVSMRLTASMAALATRAESDESDVAHGETRATGNDANVDGDPSPSNLTDLPVAPGSSSLLSVARPTSKIAQWLGPMMARPVVWSLAMFSVGAACGAGLHAVVTRHRAAPDVGVAARVNASRETSGPQTGTPVDGPAIGARDERASGALEALELALPESTPTTAPSAVAAAGRARTNGHGASLAAQQALLDEARTALARGDNSAALRAVELHARRYPDSVMIEEREALAIKALVGQGSLAEARARGERFRARFPRSLLISSIDETLGTIP